MFLIFVEEDEFVINFIILLMEINDCKGNIGIWRLLLYLVFIIVKIGNFEN